jgi:ubiquinone/menaquinone biosynthesis C-methylase UbiE
MNHSAAELNRKHAKELFDSFYKWPKESIDKEFKTAVWEHINMSEMAVISDYLNRTANSGGIALETGCGSGRLLFDLQNRYGKVVGSDFSLGLLKKAKDTGIVTAELIQSDIENLPFKDGSFDMVLCVRVIQHLSVKQQQKAVDEMSRVLKKGGSLILVNYNALTLLCLYKIWPRWPLRDWKWIIDDYSFPWELKSMFKKASLDVARLTGAVCGEPEILKFLKISHFLEKRADLLFRSYLRLCRKVDLSTNKIWPFKFFLGRLIIEGIKRR